MNYDIIYSVNTTSDTQLINIIEYNQNIKFLICVNNYDNINIKHISILYINSYIKYNLKKHLHNFEVVNKNYEFDYFVMLNNNDFFKEKINKKDLHIYHENQMNNLYKNGELYKNVDLYNNENILKNWNPSWGFEIKKNKKLLNLLQEKNINLGKIDYHCKYYKRYNFDCIIKFIKENEINNIDKLGHILINSLYYNFLLNEITKNVNVNEITQNVFCKKYKKKRMALLFFGIHYLENMNHWKGTIKTIDFSLYYENICEKVINFFSKKFNIDIFFCTNRSKTLDNLIKCYKPKRYYLVENVANHIISKNNKVLKALECCINYQKDNRILYDNIILTRFDIFFEKEFTMIDYNKLNLVSILEYKYSICDNFYLFPQKYLESFYSIFKTRKKTNSHVFKVLFEKTMDINYICNEETDICSLSFYSLHKFDDDIKHLLILNENNYEEGKVYYNINKKCNLEINCGVIKFTKLKGKYINSWFGYNLEPGKYKLSFKIKGKKIINYNSGVGLKIHNPIKIYNDFLKNINEDEFIEVKLDIITIIDSLCIFIFDNYYTEVELFVRDINFNRV
jgi:hypothetical protein